MNPPSEHPDLDVQRDAEAFQRLLSETRPHVPKHLQDDLVAVLRVAVARDPKDPARYRTLASAHYNRDEREEALRVLDLAVSQGAADDWTYRFKGQILAESGRFDEAIEAGTAALREAPHKREVLRDLFHWQFRAERHAEAKETLEQLVRVAPDWVDTQVTLSVAAAQAEDWETVERHARRALMFDRRSAAAWVNLGCALTERNRLAAAGCWLRAMVEDPEQTIPANNLAGIPETSLFGSGLLAVAAAAILWRMNPAGSREWITAGWLGLFGSWALAAYRTHLVAYMSAKDGRELQPLPLLLRAVAVVGVVIGHLVLLLGAALARALFRNGVFGWLYVAVVVIGVGSAVIGMRSPDWRLGMTIILVVCFFKKAGELLIGAATWLRRVKR